MNDSSDVKEIKKNLYSNSCIQLYKKKKKKKTVTFAKHKLNYTL